MSMCASSATNEPSVSRPSGLISARVMSWRTNSSASLATIGVSRLSADPVTPTEAISSLAMYGLKGRVVGKWRRATRSGCSEATCSMSMPPTSEKIITGCLRVPSQTTPA